LKPVSDDWQGECEKMSSKIMEGKKESFSYNPIKMFIFFINMLVSYDEKDKSQSSKKTSALTQERAKVVDEK